MKSTRQIVADAVAKERRAIALKLNAALNKHSKPMSEGGLDYVKAFREVEKLEHKLFS